MNQLAKTGSIRQGANKNYENVKWLVRGLMAVLGDPPVAMAMGNGVRLHVPCGKPAGTIVLRDRKTLLKLFLHPEFYFGEAYTEGNIEVEGDLVKVLETVFRCRSRSTKGDFLGNYAERILKRPRLNSITTSRKNIRHHYDIGNDFYRLWLDERMQYTCAYFPSPSVTLEDAQTAKMDHICRKLMLKPGDSVVEAGCGWGTLALHMAMKYGARVTAYNISHEQVSSARERAKAEGLEGRVEYVEDDYRNISGAYDAFVTIGMLEHVGVAHYRELGKVIRRSLKENGRGLLHSIGRNRAQRMNPWIERRIFPGAYPPSLREMMDIFEPFGFSILDAENLRLHYAKTLEHWLERFERSGEAAGGKFDRKFMRAWRLYLASSQAAFAAGDLQLFQVVFTHSQNNDLPWTRAHVYSGGFN